MMGKLTTALAGLALMSGCTAWGGESPPEYPEIVQDHPPEHTITTPREEGRRSVVSLMTEYWSITTEEGETPLEAVVRACRTMNGFVLRSGDTKEYFLCVDRLDIPQHLEEINLGEED